ncbi:MAG TPA: undecaprenyldiphospho-muramoylpentapeptide beta-N-acetylglucosaminyltransferase [Xanthobacteraceae bacterium]|jgi:UDP-N-acetylglucosamine--N-acetylmuramyl-(pentapeptide) pyrophosphoryl-undecaprenol N-acetylglucosamine transferase
MNGRAAPLVLIAAGGTGGHLFPAEALATVLAQRGIAVELATDKRAAVFAKSFPARHVHVLPADTVRGRDPLSLARTAWRLSFGTMRGLWLLLRSRPVAVVGFGGYPTVPPILAAVLVRVPRVVHEQNAVMGRANRVLASRATVIATGYPKIFSEAPRLAAKAVHVGNPVRTAVREAAKVVYEPPLQRGALRLVVFGGSQGARIMSEVVPAAIEFLPPTMRGRVEIVQQCRAEDLDEARAAYSRLDVKADVATFFADLPAKVAAAHLVIARSGASTVAELAAIGRPAILVPLPHALDQDQLANAAALAAAGGALLIRQSDFTAERLGRELETLLADPSKLSAMAAAARKVGRVDAAERLADEVMRVAGLAQMREKTPA